MPTLFLMQLNYCPLSNNNKHGTFCSDFYPRDAQHSAVFATATCLSVTAGIVSKRLNLS